LDRLRIVGGQALNGVITISGAKNAALPLMIASLLTPSTLTLENVPNLADVHMLLRILSHHGVDYSVDGRRPGAPPNASRAIHLSARQIVDIMAPYDLVSRMRASFWVIAPLLARTGEAKVSLPGGCAIGTRPVDLLIMVLESLGARVEIEAGYVHATAGKGLTGAEIRFPKVTVGGTQTALMAASLANGHTRLINAACEPEIADLAACLNKMGAKIRGAGEPHVEIEGVTSLAGARHTVMPDRIEAGTYAMATVMAGGDVTLEGAHSSLLESALEAISCSGAEISETNKGLRVRRDGADLAPVDVVTAPFPGFPTDLQAQFMALMTTAKGTSRITETIFENRFIHVQELVRLGARIKLEGDAAVVEGVEALQGAPVMATDLRASMSLVIAALAAKGETIVNRVYHLDRGFEHIEEKLGACGAIIQRLTERG
jgi:UDP-N-acetylglucosamine 1-carboxyvinyltransferase